VAKAKVGVLISGNGSNLQALIDASRSSDYPAQISLVISNKTEAYGLARAKTARIPATVIDHKNYGSREEFDRAMDAELRRHGIEIVCLAGFMRLLSPWFVGQWKNKMLNIHPSLLPNFKGAHAVRDALQAGAKETGCTVHVVTEELDSGPAILQGKVPVRPGDSEETLHQRIHEQEHKVYPQALKELILRSRNR
jgi:phosphoribosylglycinamide formyltransferase 1